MRETQQPFPKVGRSWICAEPAIAVWEVSAPGLWLAQGRLRVAGSYPRCTGDCDDSSTVSEKTSGRA